LAVSEDAPFFPPSHKLISDTILTTPHLFFRSPSLSAIEYLSSILFRAALLPRAYVKIARACFFSQPRNAFFFSWEDLPFHLGCIRIYVLSPFLFLRVVNSPVRSTRVILLFLVCLFFFSQILLPPPLPPQRFEEPLLWIL